MSQRTATSRLTVEGPGGELVASEGLERHWLAYPNRDIDPDSWKRLWSPRAGMSTSEGKTGERVRDVRFTDDLLVVDLLDGRTISVPLVWYPRLLSATPAQRANWRVAGGGFGIHWPDVDEDLSTEGLLRGAPAPRGSAAAGQ